jgi:flagellin
LQKEVAQLKSEVDRVASTTSFNGTKLLDGSFTSKAFQVGANAGETIGIDSVVDANVNKLGTSYQVSTAALTAPTTAATASVDAAFAAVASGLTIAVNGEAAITLPPLDAIAVKPASGSASDLAKADKAAVQQRLQDVASAISEATSGRVTATVENDGKLTIRSLESFALTGGTATTTAFVAQSGGLQDGFANVDISTVQGADDAIIRMDGALKAVNSARADLGAIQNRFEAVVSNLAVNSENLSASRSRIMDADFAQETANLSRSQILQQAGTAMVAQANQLPQNVLKLLQ